MMDSDCNLKIIIASDVEYECVFAEIYYNDKFIALVSQEEGLDKLKIEFRHDLINYDDVVMKMDIDCLRKAIDLAAKALDRKIETQYDSPEEANRAGQQRLDRILHDPAAVATGKKKVSGAFDVFAADGWGARFDSEGEFTGFLEPVGFEDV
jgi:hypothetical protein